MVKNEIDLSKAFPLRGNIQIREVPFLHFFGKNVFREEDAKSLLEWFETTAEWHLHCSSFFEQFELNLINQNLPTTCRWITDQQFIESLIQQASKLFSTNFSSRITITAHRLVAGQKIGIHNDSPQQDFETEELETHRLVVHFNQEWLKDYGGQLILFNSKNPNDVHSVFEPLHNTCVGFALSDNSYHAVNLIKKGVRYSVVFSFWGKERPVVSLSENSDWLYSVTKFLETQNTSSIPHSGHSTLFLHLKGVGEILSRWGYEPAVCKAGYLHSIYGTEGFPMELVSRKNRETIQLLIGKKAEELVYLFCTLDRASLIEAVKNEYPVFSNNGTSFSIDHETLSNLIAIDFANIAEQLPRLTDNIEIITNDHNWFVMASKLLNPIAVAELEELFKWICDERSGEFKQDFNQIITFLEDAGANHVLHSNTTLLAHLMGTWEILKRWKCPYYLQIAGLCHSLYGWRTVPSIANRALLRVTLGHSAERLLYLYATINVGDLLSAYSLFPISQTQKIELPSYDGQHTESMTEEEVCDFFTLETANLLDQFYRIQEPKLMSQLIKIRNEFNKFPTVVKQELFKINDV